VSSDFVNAIQELAKEKGIDPEVLFKAVEDALVVAYKKNFDSTQTVRVELDKNKGDFHVFEQRTVVETSTNPHDQISLADAQKINPDYQLEDIMEQEVFPKDFSRIAVQNAKQIIMQRIREAERGIVYDEYSGREEDIVTGIIQRSERGTVFIDLGKVEAILAQNEQIPGEIYRYHDRMKFYIIEVKKTSKGPQILVSRTHPGLLKRLFELEVPKFTTAL
jgi:N utilization substance protein A